MNDRLGSQRKVFVTQVLRHSPALGPVDEMVSKLKPLNKLFSLSPSAWCITRTNPGPARTIADDPRSERFQFRRCVILVDLLAFVQ